MEWSNEVVLEFLSFYEAEPIIWNPRDPNHKNRNLIHDAWKRIQEQMSVKCSIEELKKKKDTLMGTFRKLLQKVKASSKTGSGSDEVVKPEWFAYEFMYKFLKGVYLPNKTRDSENLQGEGRTEDNENADENESGEVIATEEIAHGSQFRPPKAKNLKRKIHLPPDIEQKMDEAYKVFKNFTDTQMSPHDQCSLYGELLATKLRALAPDTREVAMIEIDLLVYRLKHRNNEGPEQHFCHVNRQNVPVPSTASFSHNSSQYQGANFEPVVHHTLSRPPSSASSHHSVLSNPYSCNTNSSSPSPLAPILSEQHFPTTLPSDQQLHIQPTALPLSSPPVTNSSQHSTTTLPSAAQQVHIQPTVSTLLSPSTENYSQHSTTTLPSTSAAIRQYFSNYSSEKVTVHDASEEALYEDY